jgi:hypothetical protein
MKTISAFFVPAVCLAQGLHFEGAPSVRRFADGSIEWSASITCEDPSLLLGSHVEFSLDGNADGVGDTAALSTALSSASLSPADCEGERLSIRRGFFPQFPAVLRAELFTARAGTGSPDSLTDVHALLTGEIGSLLSLRRFCARPRDGEPEWIEVRNVSTVAISLAKVRLEGRALPAVPGLLDPGEGLTAVAAADTAELRLWQPGARVFPLSSGPGLRNTGDTLRLSLDVQGRGGSTFALMLDSVVYGAGPSPREGCASAPTEESGGGAYGFAMELPPGRWKRRAGPLRVTIVAPAGGAYDLRVYDLDGLELCALARRAGGPQAFSLSSASCGRLPASATAVLIQLQPHRGPALRRLLWMTP